MKLYNRIETEAAILLSKHEIFQPPIPIEKIIKRENLSLKAFPFGEDISGALYIENGQGTIGFNPLESSVRRRFTIAHELGHFILHNRGKNQDVFVDQTSVLYRKQPKGTAEYKREREANAFAAAILMPRDMLYDKFENINETEQEIPGDLIIEKLAKLFDVSSQAMTYRLINLDLIAYLG